MIRFSHHRTARLGFAFLVLLWSGLASPASADPADGGVDEATPLGEVVVLPVAGTEEARVFEARSSPDGKPTRARVRQTGTRTLLPDDLAPSIFTDIKITGERSHLIAGVEGRGAVWVSPPSPRDPLDAPFVLSHRRERSDIDAVSLAAQGPGRQPERIIFNETDERRLTIYDTRLDASVWSYRLTSPPTRSEVVQVITAPERRIAYAANWLDEGLSAVDIVNLTSAPPSVPVLRFANTSSDTPSPTETVVDKRLTDLRDLFGRRDGTLLATTSDWLLVLSPDTQSVEHAFELANHSELMGGEFVSARQLDSGYVAVATVEPGLWNRPASNHRIYWLTSDLSTLLARTPPLQQAPWRVEASDGHGGSGTLGFTPPDDFLPKGEADDIQVPGGEWSLAPQPLRTGTQGQLKASLLQTGRFPVVLARAQLVAHSGPCDEPREGAPEVLVERRDLVLPSRGDRTFRASFDVSPTSSPGARCFELRGRQRSDDGWTTFGDRRTVRVVSSERDAGSGGGRRIDPIDLGVRVYDDTSSEPTPRRDGSSPPSENPQPPPSTGCECRTASTSPPVPLHWGLSLFVWMMMRGRRSARSSSA